MFKFALLTAVAILVRAELNYTSCFDATRYCSGIPQDCVDSKTCDVLFHGVYDVLNKVLIGDLNALNAMSSSYVAVALSRDAEIGSDSAHHCLITSNGTPKGGQGRIVDSKKYVVSEEIPGIINNQSNFEDQTVHCRFYRSTTISHDGEDWPLEGGPGYYFVMTGGKLDSSGNPGSHDRMSINATRVMFPEP
ncbi:hypothetical protein HDE_00323 [Halotydeus destructor]|nr:hypothetical protein HDE_00323 [Halotydeus destructor]